MLLSTANSCAAGKMAWNGAVAFFLVSSPMSLLDSETHVAAWRIAPAKFLHVTSCSIAAAAKHWKHVTLPLTRGHSSRGL